MDRDRTRSVRDGDEAVRFRRTARTMWERLERRLVPGKYVAYRLGPLGVRSVNSPEYVLRLLKPENPFPIVLHVHHGPAIHGRHIQSQVQLAE